MARFSLGDAVCLKTDSDRFGVVRSVRTEGPEPEYDVFFGTNEQRTYPERSLMAEDEVGAVSDPVGLLRQWRLGDADSFRSFLTLAKLNTPLADNLYSFVASRTERLPYQFKPVLKLLESPYSRLLIADEVGLGKTIEAGIILMELQARSPLEHVLVACPSALLVKWQRELRERFDLDFETLDGPTYRERMREIAVQPLQPLRAIASIELLRRAENLDILVEYKPRFDVLIADEAHHFRNSGTRQNAVGEMLASLAQTVIFLTATPLNLGRHDFFELLRILVPEEFTDMDTFASVIEPNEHINAALRTLRGAWPPDFKDALERLRDVEQTSQGHRFSTSARYQGLLARLERGAAGDEFERSDSVRCQRDLIELNTLSHVFTRTKKREVADKFPTRRPHAVRVEFTPGEDAFYRAVTDWAGAQYNEGAFGGNGFVTTMFQRQAASCLPAMARKLGATVLAGQLDFARDEWREIAEEEDLDPEDPITLALDRNALTPLDKLHSSWRQYSGEDSKFAEFSRAVEGLVREGISKILVFSFFRGTIEYLEERLRELEIGGRHLKVLKLYGPMSSDARHEAVNQFRSTSEPVVLLSSEVGSEGLDFQFCSAMVNYDLPWNPMRVEQRIGRLDRYGQSESVIQILNMIVTDTVEDRIFYRLYERIEIFTQSIGDLEGILGEVSDTLRDLQRIVLSRSLTPDEAEQRANQVADVIVRRQQEHEEFDKDSRRFLGNDDVFLERFNDIEHGRRYITSSELRNFLARFLTDRFPRVQLADVGDEGVELRGAGMGGLVSFMSMYIARHADRARLTRQFVARLQTADPMHITFDPHRALEDRTLEFISLHHPLVRAVARERADSGDSLPTGYLQVRRPGTASGPRCFFMFELNATGLKDRLEFEPVIVGPGGEIDVELARDFSALVDAAEIVPAEIPLLSEEQVMAAESAAQRWIAAEVERRELDLSQLNDEVIDAQLESLRLSFDRRIVWLRERLELDTDERILRMRRGQLANLEQDHESRVMALKAKRGVTVGRSLVAAGVVECV